MDEDFRFVKLRFAGITITMRSETFGRLKAGLLAGLLASAVLGFVIWLFGYITGYRLTTSLLSIAAVVCGLISGAQAYIAKPEELPQDDAVLAELERQSEQRALGHPGGKGRRS